MQNRADCFEPNGVARDCSETDTHRDWRTDGVGTIAA
jgi:hypothetical protein